MSASSSDLRQQPAIVEAARLLGDAASSRTPCDPVKELLAPHGIDAAYAVQSLLTDAAEASGRRVVGRKIGLTSVAVQTQLGVDQPDFGMLFDDMEYLSGADLPMSRLMQPKVEAEVAFVVGRDLTASVPSWAEFLLAVAYALPALEIVDSAIADWKISLADTVADNASCGLYVLGDQPVALGMLGLDALGMRMRIGGQTVATGGGAACLGHPLRAAYWLACTMGVRGHGLREGEVILSGALGPMVPVAAGDVVHAEIGALGSVGCRML